MRGIGSLRAGHRRRSISVLALAAAFVVPLTATQVAGAQPLPTTGFAIPFAGAPAFEHVGPTQLTSTAQLNQPIGQQWADRVAAQIGLGPADALTEQQFRDLTTGGGTGGNRDAAKIIDQCAWILSNTNGRPITANVGGTPTPTVLASYGVYVTTDGLLQSPANEAAPTRQVNTLISPGGFVGNWMRDNGATRTLIALYRSAFTIEALFGFASQQISGAAQLVTNTKGNVSTVVGMSMVPPIWIVNFALLYLLKPSLAAAMPAYWAPIPGPVVDAIKASPTGQVPYVDFAKYFK
ncbi:hypothetical protein [Aldersonia kunmingensis]|uniref:hypothetical protein n=1 Tax=Aldersonia kunmingensis TaxID=408066 RepID=UPI0008317FD5|nr:hypothetical protein [Aldersonia kunmingensis]